MGPVASGVTDAQADQTLLLWPWADTPGSPTRVHPRPRQSPHPPSARHRNIKSWQLVLLKVRLEPGQ